MEGHRRAATTLRPSATSVHRPQTAGGGGQASTEAGQGREAVRLRISQRQPEYRSNRNVSKSANRQPFIGPPPQHSAGWRDGCHGEADSQLSGITGGYSMREPASPPESLTQATRSGLQQIIVRAGAKRRSAGLLAALEDAFADAGIVTYPRLSDPKNRPDQRILLRSAQPAQGRFHSPIFVPRRGQPSAIHPG